MAKLIHKPYVLFLALWAVIFLLFAFNLNIKGIYEADDTFFAKSGYNFEYKRGFPTPWYSRYYKIPTKHLHNYQEINGRTATPPDSYLVWTDKSWSVLGGQAALATISALFLLLIAKGLTRISSRHRSPS